MIFKMTLLAVMRAVFSFCLFKVGPRQLEALEPEANGERISPEEVRKARMMSMTASVLGLLMALALMVMGVMLNSVSWSLQAS